MFSPIRLTVSADLVAYLCYGDSSFMDYRNLPDAWLADVDAELAALNVESWGEVDEFPQDGRCDLSGDLGPCVQITGYIRQQGAPINSDADSSTVRRMITALLGAFGSAACAVTPAGFETVEVEGCQFVFWPKDLHREAFSIRISRKTLFDIAAQSAQ